MISFGGMAGRGTIGRLEEFLKGFDVLEKSTLPHDSLLHRMLSCGFLSATVVLGSIGAEYPTLAISNKDSK